MPQEYGNVLTISATQFLTTTGIAMLVGFVAIAVFVFAFKK